MSMPTAPNVEWKVVTPIGAENLRIALQSVSDQGFTVREIFASNQHNFTMVVFKPKALA